MVKNKSMIRCLVLILCLPMLASSIPAFASQHKTTAQYQDIALIKRAIEDFLYNNTGTLSGQVIVNVGQIDKHLALPQCPHLEPFVPTGGRLWGKTSIGVRCDSQVAKWTIYVPVSYTHLTLPTSDLV